MDLSTQRHVKAAIERGVKRLLNLVSDGRWLGFPTLAGQSDTWVTGFILAHLKPLGFRRRELTLAKNYLLSAQETSGGWSYGVGVPPDADSTAWCLMALQGNKRLTLTRRKAAEAFLLNHSSEYGVSTYLPDSGIADYIQANNYSIEGWTEPHPDVTAASLLTIDSISSQSIERALLARLLAWQTGAGFFEAYWWRGPHYTTALILRLLHKHSLHLPEAKAQLLLNALRREQLPDGGYSLGAAMEINPFNTALALESLSYLNYLDASGECQATGNALLEAQQEDGGWLGDFVLRIPAPNVRDPHNVPSWNRQGGGGNSYIFDRDGLFATVLSCHALHQWLCADVGQPNQGNAWTTIYPQTEVLFAGSEQMFYSQK